MATAVDGKSKILVIGGTGYIGKYIVQASVAAGHPTFLLVRKATVESTEDGKAKLLRSFRDAGVSFLYGDLFDHRSLVRAIRQADVVISTVSRGHILEQTRIVDAIKEAGGIKRFFPSEFGNDVDRVHAAEPAKSLYEGKAKIRRLLESESIPHTILSSNFFADYFLRSLAQPGHLLSPPRDKVIVLGDGNTKAVFAAEQDIGTYTIRAVDDPRTLNKILYLRPPANMISFNELAALWESKMGKTLEKVFLSEEDVLNQIKELMFPANVMLAILHSAFVKGDQTNFPIEPSFGVEASELYPDVAYTTVGDILNRYV